MTGNKKIIPKKQMKGLPKTAFRACGHPFYPTFDIIEENGYKITSYCIHCLLKKIMKEIKLNPCSQCYVKNLEDWQDPEKVIWVFNR